MADENKKTEETVVQEVARGDRGIVGEATTEKSLKQMWHEATHRLVEVGDKTNPHRQAWVLNRGAPSLKRWARDQIKEGNKLAKEWFANKGGVKNMERSEKNQKRVFEEKQASKAARRKAGAAKQNKPKTEGAAPAAK